MHHTSRRTRINHAARARSVVGERLPRDYDARRIAALEQADALAERAGLTRREIGERIGRSERCVCAVLNGTDSGLPTLELIEDLLEQVEEDA